MEEKVLLEINKPPLNKKTGPPRLSAADVFPLGPRCLLMSSAYHIALTVEQIVRAGTSMLPASSIKGPDKSRGVICRFYPLFRALQSQPRIAGRQNMFGRRTIDNSGLLQLLATCYILILSLIYTKRTGFCSNEKGFKVQTIRDREIRLNIFI